MKRWRVNVITKPAKVTRLVQPVGYGSSGPYLWRNGFLLRVSPRRCVFAVRLPR